MRHAKCIGFTLTELLLVIAIAALAAIILLPTQTRVRSPARRTVCAQNLGQIHKAILMYEADNEGFYPNLAAKGKNQFTDGDAQQALNLLYRQYTDDVRIFSCPAKPLSHVFMNQVLPSTTSGWPGPNGSSFKESPPGVPGYSTSYGYSTGHNSSQNSRVIIVADRQGTGSTGNSDNHGNDRGQNVLSAGGAVEWRGGVKGKENQLGLDDSKNAIIDYDIFAINPIPLKEIPEWDSFCR